jgi:hypothetical protein
VKFKYLGPTTETKKLASGHVRLQFGLKLRAADSCNLVYAMWRIKPASEAGLVVSVKRNEGMTTGKQCSNGGYHTIQPKSALKVAAFHQGESHAMRAEMTVRTTQQTKVAHLQVWIDHKRVWDGDLPPMATDFDGPVGIRSDNVHVQFQLLAPPPGAATVCKESKNENE